MVSGLREVFAGGSPVPLLSGLDDPDDAAVWQADAGTFVFTVDFFPPVVDDPFTYGAVAATNALSDVFAMGGRPLVALNVAGFPEDMPAATAAAILRGGAEKVREAGAVVGGGHTTRSLEPTFGLAVVGRVDPEHLVRKGGAMPGDVLVLTKGLGTGVLTTAGKQGSVAAAHLEAAVASMTTLNARAGAAARRAGVRCGTDVTGFGLLGHLLEMLEASGCGARVDAGAVPLLPGAREYGTFPGGTASNEGFFADRVRFTAGVQSDVRRLFFSPETAGGLLAAVPPAGLPAFDGLGTVIGVVETGQGVRVER